MRLSVRRIVPALSLLAVAALVGACEKDPGLRITGIEPNVGPVTGGGTVTVSGSGFQAGGVKGVRVYFGENESRRVFIEGDGMIKVEPPAGKAEQTVDVMFLFDDARKLEYPKAYTYRDFTKNSLGPDSLVNPTDAP